MKSVASSLTGLTEQTGTGKNQNADGFSAGKRIVAASDQECARIAEWLARRTPQEADKVAVSRAQQHGVGLQVKYDWRFPTGPNGENLPSYRIAVGCTAKGGDKLAALADLQNLMIPAPARQIEEWLAELSVISASRQTSDFESGLKLTAYTSRLREYPADVARHALLKRRWKFFPTWEELATVCDSLVSPRKWMLAAMEREEKPEAVRRAPTDEEKARIQALIDELFPQAPEEWRERAAGHFAVDESKLEAEE